MQNASVSIPTFSNNRVDDILTGKDDGFRIQPNKTMLRSDRTMTGFCAWVVRGLNRNDTGGEFLFVQTFSCDTNCDDGACFNNWKVESFSEDHLPGTRPNGDHNGDGDDLESRF